MSENLELTEIIPGKFYFATFLEYLPQSDASNLYVNVDQLFGYPSINSYFGPPTLSTMYHYCEMMAHVLKNSRSIQRIIHCTSYSDAMSCTNSVFLLGSFLLLVYNSSPSEVIRKIKSLPCNILAYVDTTSFPASPTLNMKYFFNGLQKARILNWFSMATFNPYEYELLLGSEGGDMSWVLPGKFLAFADPVSRIQMGGIDFYINYFRRYNITTVIRLNDRNYDAQMFEERGINHYDIFFEDCTCPNKVAVEKFLYITECSPGAIAVHCKAGMGRTGTMIAAYIIKHYYVLTALETTAWLRLCRPGSVIGLQQRFLQLNELWLKYQTKNICSKGSPSRKQFKKTLEFFEQ